MEKKKSERRAVKQTHTARVVVSAVIAEIITPPTLAAKVQVIASAKALVPAAAKV